MQEVSVTQQKKKRARPEKPKCKIVRNQFVCSYTGMLIDIALAPKCTPGHAFVNLPCAVAWARTQPNGENIAIKLAKEYDQTLEGIEIPLPLEDLVQFGGTMGYDTWSSKIHKWDMHTPLAGTSVKDYLDGPVAGSKKSKSKPAVVTKLDKGVHLLRPDGKVLTATHHDATEEKGVTVPSKLIRAIATHLKKGEETGRRVTVVPCATDAGFIVCTYGDEDEVNHNATRLAGTGITGPALVLNFKAVKFPQ